MLELEVTICPEAWNEKTQEFVEPKTVKLQLEHSLISVSKWESKWKKPFLSNKEKSPEETLSYIKCMLLKPVDPDILNHLSQANILEINEYISDPMTATTFHDDGRNSGGTRETVTAELIYHWMIELGIWEKCEKWHLNRLLTLIRVRNVKNTPPKKMSQGEIMRRNASLNAARRKALNTKG